MITGKGGVCPRARVCVFSINYYAILAGKQGDGLSVCSFYVVPLACANLETAMCPCDNGAPQLLVYGPKHVPLASEGHSVVVASKAGDLTALSALPSGG